MPAKCFLVKVELAVQKISCPGVWLCSNGKISLQLCMLDSIIQTDSYKPLFPIIFSEKFIFYKTFLKEKRLNELQRSLGREWLRAELIQWKNCDEGVVLANFQTTLDDLLYPSAFRTINLAGTNVDLLMEPTKLFPGTISPKLELRTKTTVKETYCDLKQRYSDKSFHGHQAKPSSFAQTSSRKLHPRRVCHTVAYSKAQQKCRDLKKDKRPIFKYKKAEDDLILRTNPDKVVKDDIVRLTGYLEADSDENNDANGRNKISKETSCCYCGQSTSLPIQEDTTSSFVKSVKKIRSKYDNQSQQKCIGTCSTQHESYFCPICSKYECTFPRTTKSTKEFLADPLMRNSSLKLCSYCRENFEQPEESLASPPEKKVCFCLPERKTSSLAQRLHQKLKNTMQSGAASIENCIRDCEVDED